MLNCICLSLVLSFYAFRHRLYYVLFVWCSELVYVIDNCVVFFGFGYCGIVFDTSLKLHFVILMAEKFILSVCIIIHVHVYYMLIIVCHLGDLPDKWP